MKALARARTEHHEQELAWKAADADLSAQIAILFERCPELSGFSVQPKVFADAPNHGSEEELFVTAISISPRLSKEQYADVFERISATLMQLLAERPEAHCLLRGRTFARIFH
jgi:hypothetical protein